MNAHAPQLSRRRKAALIVQMIVGEGRDLSLDTLPQAVQYALTKELGAIRLVDRETVSTVAEEFVAELGEIGLSAPGTPDGAIAAIAEHLSPDVAKDLNSQLESVRNGDHWPLVTAMSVDRLATILEAESTEVSAITLSKLPTGKAAEVLALTPGALARQVTYAMSKTSNIAPDVVLRIGKSLALDYGTPEVRAFGKPAEQRLGAILNSTASEVREDVLEGIVSEDESFGRDVRKAIFTFKDIATRLKATDVPNSIRNVDGEVLITAIAAGMAGDDSIKASTEFILSSVSQRMAGQLREDAQELGSVKKADAEKAMTAVTTAIRELVEAGTITLIEADEQEDE